MNTYKVKFEDEFSAESFEDLLDDLGTYIRDCLNEEDFTAFEIEQLVSTKPPLELPDPESVPVEQNTYLDFEFEHPFCSKCGEPATQIAEKMAVQAHIHLDPSTGGYSYIGESEVLWDTQVVDDIEHGPDLGKCELMCDQGHTWRTNYRTTITE